MSYRMYHLMNRRPGTPRAARPAPAKPRVVEDRTVPFVMPPEWPDWQVVMVGPRCEAVAVAALRQAGFDAWMPRMVVMISSSSLGKKAFINRPLWPRYVLANRRHGTCTSLRDIHDIGKPLIVGKLSGALVGSIAARERAGEFDCRSLPPAGHVFDAGAHVETFDGMLQGIVLKSDEARTVVLFRLLDAEREVQVETARLQVST